MNNIIPVLAIRQPWASLIAEGHKTIEVRSRNTLKRGRIAIYASRTKELELDNVLDGTKRLPHGQIIATAYIEHTFIPTSLELFKMYGDEHLVTDAYYVPGKTYCWRLSDIKKIEPIEYKMSKGHIVWDKVDENLIKELI